MEETFDEGSGNKETAKEPSSPETAKDKDTGSIDDVTADGGENEANISFGSDASTQPVSWRNVEDDGDAEIDENAGIIAGNSSVTQDFHLSLEGTQEQQAEAESTANIIEEKPAILRNHGDDEKDMFATDDDEDEDDEIQVVEVSKANATAAADISCIVLDDSTGSNETPSRTSAFIKVPSVSTDSKMCEDSETTSPPPNQQAVKRRQLNPVCPDSESSDFEAIKRAKMMAVNSQEESELSATTTMQHHSEMKDSADDEGNSRPPSSLTVTASPADISVSPIITAGATGTATTSVSGGGRGGGQAIKPMEGLGLGSSGPGVGGENLRQRLLRRTSTPGRNKSDKTSSEDDPQLQVSPRKRQRKTGTVEKPQLNINSTIEEGETRDEISVGTDDENVFKLPHSATLPSSMTDSGSRPAASTSTNNKSGSTNEEYVNLLVTVKASQVKDIPSTNMFQLKSGTLEEMNDNFRMYKRAVPQLLANRRVSDASSLSSYSSSSGGYLGDVGSSCGTMSSSGSSQASKRDRLSIMPDTPIEAHNKIAPLPNHRLSKVTPTPPESDAQNLNRRPDSQNSDEKIESSLQSNEMVEIEERVVEEEVGVNKENENVEVLPIKARRQMSNGGSVSNVNKGKRLKTKGERDLSRQRNKSAEEEDAALSEEIPVVSPLKEKDIRQAIQGAKTLAVGDKVFAKWVQRTDVRYWPGVIEEAPESQPSQDVVDVYYVMFFDGVEKCGLHLDDVIPAASLLPGQQVNVCLGPMEEGVSHRALLTTHPDCTSKDIHYNVDIESIEGMPQTDSLLVSYKKVHLTNDQAKEIKSELGALWRDGGGRPSKTNADLSLDNLLTGKRRSKLSSKTDDSTQGPSTPSRKSGRTVKRGGHLVETSVNEDEGENVLNRAKTPAKKTTGKHTFVTPRTRTPKTIKEQALKALTPLDTTEDEAPIIGTPTKRGRPRTKNKDTPKKGSKSEESNQSPRKSVWISSLFKGLTFVLTQGAHPVSEPKDLNTSMTSALESETETEQQADDAQSVKNTGFIRAAITQTIIENGGVVLSEFPGAKSPVKAGLMVISDRQCSTMTYLLGVAYKFRLLSYLWITQCVAEQKLLPHESYLLPVGYSQLEKRSIEQEERSSNLGKSELFTNLHLLLTSNRPEFGSDWKPILTRLGASVSFRSKGKIDRNLKLINVVISDAADEAPDSIIESATEKAIPIVNAGWIIESLFQGIKVPHKHFLFNSN